MPFLIRRFCEHSNKIFMVLKAKLSRDMNRTSDLLGPNYYHLLSVARLFLFTHYDTVYQLNSIVKRYTVKWRRDVDVGVRLLILPLKGERSQINGMTNWGYVRYRILKIHLHFNGLDRHWRSCGMKCSNNDNDD